MAIKTATPEVLTIPPMEIRQVRIRIVGTSPLIMNKWSEKAKAQMRDSQMGKARSKKEPKSPEADYEAATYRCPNGAPGFPTIAFKAAAVDAASQVSGLTKVFLRGAFHTIGELVEVEGTPRMREDMVRVGMQKADLRYRPEFPEWAVSLPVRFNACVITLAQLTHLFRQAGFSVGVGEWRPAKDGSYGMFDVESVEEVTDGNSHSANGHR